MIQLGKTPYFVTGSLALIVCAALGVAALTGHVPAAFGAPAVVMATFVLAFAAVVVGALFVLTTARGRTTRRLRALAALALDTRRSADELLAEGKQLARSLVGEVSSEDVERVPEIIDALKRRGPLRAECLRVLSQVPSVRAIDDAIMQHLPDWDERDFPVIVEYFAQDLRRARDVAHSLLPRASGEVLLALIARLVAVAPYPPQEEWVELFGPYRDALAASRRGNEAKIDAYLAALERKDGARS